MRNELVTCIIKIGEERGRKSALERALRTDKKRYIEAWRVISYRFLSIGRLLGATLETLWGHLELKNRLGGFLEALLRLEIGFAHFDADHFGGFWRGFGKHFGDILLSLVDVNFIMHFDMIFK